METNARFHFHQGAASSSSSGVGMLIYRRSALHIAVGGFSLRRRKGEKRGDRLKREREIKEERGKKEGEGKVNKMEK